MRRVLGALPVWLLAALLGTSVWTWMSVARPGVEAIAAGVVVASVVIGVWVGDRYRTLPDDVDEVLARLRRVHRVSSWAQPTMSVAAFLLLIGGFADSRLWLVGIAVLVAMRLLWWEEYRTARHLRDVRPPFAYPPA